MFELIAAAQIGLASPDGRIEITVASDGSTYSVTRDHQDIITPSPLGLALADAPAFAGLRLVKVKKQSRDRTLNLTATKAATARDNYQGEILTFEEASGQHRRLVIEVRAYNDGVAWRYVVPGTGPVAVAGEATAFRPAGDPTCFVSEYSGAHEMGWNPMPVSQLDSAKQYDYPVLCAAPGGRTSFAIAQSGLSGYASSALKPGPDGLHVQVSYPPDRKDVAVKSPHGLQTAWRVLLMADRAGDLIASPLIGDLVPQAKGDFSWVKPGKVAWDWWSGPTAGGTPTMENYRRFIDFAGDSGFPYFLIDAGWALGATPCCAADPNTDITQANPALDMPALVAYAKSKGVGLILWAHWKHVEPRMDEVLDTYQRWGIKGVKVDFMERDDQDMVAFYERLARETAKRHLLLDMHGAYPPAGLARTYPNYITQEGVMGAEYNKFPWGQITPSHNVRLAYTRMLLGPMDYTPGGFHNAYPDTYVQTEIMPSTRFTRGQALAQYVVYDSPLQMVSDDPSAYQGAAGFDFIKAVPTAWDETRFIDGTPDGYVVIARRKGQQWYVGAMTDEQARKFDIPLAFLDGGEYEAAIWQDGASANAVDRTTATVSNKDRISVALNRGGGGAIILTRKNP